MKPTTFGRGRPVSSCNLREAEGGGEGGGLPGRGYLVSQCTPKEMSALQRPSCPPPRSLMLLLFAGTGYLSCTHELANLCSSEMIREIHRLQLAHEAGLNGTRSLNAMDMSGGPSGRAVGGSEYFGSPQVRSECAVSGT